MKEQPRVTTGIKTNLTPQGEARVELHLADATYLISPDAAVELALNLLSAAYAARGEHAAYVYAKQHNMNASEFIKMLRNHTKEILGK